MCRCRKKKVIGYCVRWGWGPGANGEQRWTPSYLDKHGATVWGRRVMSSERAYQVMAGASTRYDRWGFGAAIRRVVRYV